MCWHTSPAVLSPHRMPSITCSVASILASGSPTPSLVRPRRGRRRALGTHCWKPSPKRATRKTSVRDPSPEKRNLATMSLALDFFTSAAPHILAHGLPHVPCPPACPQHSSDSLLRVEGLCCLQSPTPISVMPKSWGSGEGQQLPGWSTGLGIQMSPSGQGLSLWVYGHCFSSV